MAMSNVLQFCYPHPGNTFGEIGICTARVKRGVLPNGCAVSAILKATGIIHTAIIRSIKSHFMDNHSNQPTLQVADSTTSVEPDPSRQKEPPEATVLQPEVELYKNRSRVLNKLEEFHKKINKLQDDVHQILKKVMTEKEIMENRLRIEQDRNRLGGQTRKLRNQTEKLRKFNGRNERRTAYFACKNTQNDKESANIV